MLFSVTLARITHVAPERDGEAKTSSEIRLYLVFLAFINALLVKRKIKIGGPEN